MLRSLYSGVSGMKNLQTKMDVVANNIANANTIGFKSSRVMFSDLMSQTLADSSAPSNSLGGINAKQVGLGLQVAATDLMTTVGAPQTTGRTLDFYISGSGYFTLKGSDGTSYYTRAGNFYLDSGDGTNYHLVDAQGQKVQAYMLTAPKKVTADVSISSLAQDATSTGNSQPAGYKEFGNLDVPLKTDGATYVSDSLSVDANGYITGKYQNGNTQDTYVLGRLPLATFSNTSGLQKVGNSDYVASNNSGAAQYGTVGENGTKTIQSGALEMSNVDLANEFTEMIIASRAYSANAKVITTSDEMLQDLVNLKR